MPELSVAVIDIRSKEKTEWAIDDTESGKDVA